MAVSTTGKNIFSVLSLLYLQGVSRAWSHLLTLPEASISVGTKSTSCERNPLQAL